jgi:dUTP pyrophosphatase
MHEPFTLPFVFVDAAAAAGDADAQRLLTPRRHTKAAAGLDLVAASTVTLAPGQRALVSTGIAVAIPSGFEGQIRPRSGLALQHGLTCLNSPGTIDSDYRGELRVLLVHHGHELVTVERGWRIAQLVIAPVVEASPLLVASLDETERGQGGFGSTGWSVGPGTGAAR